MLKRQALSLLALALATAFAGTGALAYPADGRIYTYPVDTGFVAGPPDYVYSNPPPLYYHYATPTILLYPSTGILDPDIKNRQMEKFQRSYYLTRNFHKRSYGDPNEYYGFKRGPRLREAPPYRAFGPEAKPMGIPKVDLSFANDGSLKVAWAQRTQPVTSVQLAFIDQFGKELSQQTVTQLPLQANLTVPEGATDLRVTVNYADGGVSSSATKLPK